MLRAVSIRSVAMAIHFSWGWHQTCGFHYLTACLSSEMAENVNYTHPDVVLSFHRILNIHVLLSFKLKGPGFRFLEVSVALFFPHPNKRYFTMDLEWNRSWSIQCCGMSTLRFSCEKLVLLSLDFGIFKELLTNSCGCGSTV